MADQETIDPRLHRLVTITLTEAEALALADCAEVGVEGAEDNVGQDVADRGYAALRKVREAIEPSACPTVGPAAPARSRCNCPAANGPQGHATWCAILTEEV